MCDADDTPRTTLPGHFIGIGQSRQCRDWNKYIGWTKQFDSCYAHITDNKRTFYEIERFKFCPEGSPYLPAVRDHFGLGEDWNREKGLKELREKTLEELGLA